MIGKEEFYKKVKDKISLSKEEFEKEFNAAIEELKERGIPEKEHEQLALTMVKAKLKKQLISPSKKFTGYIIGINPNGAFNRVVDMVKEDSILQWRGDEERATEMKFCDANGNPLWHIIEGHNVADWKIGSVISEDDYSETVILMAKKEDDKNLKLTHLTLRGAKRSIDKPRFFEVEFLANIKSMDGPYVLNQSLNTEFKKIGNEEINFPEFAKKYLSRNCVDIQSLEMWHDKFGDDVRRTVITKGTVINIVPSIDEGRNHIVNLDSGEELFDNKAVTCWVNHKEELNFNEATPEIYVLGQTNLKVNEETSEKRMSLNVYGIYVPKEWRRERPKEIKDDTPEKEVEEDKDLASF